MLTWIVRGLLIVAAFVAGWFAERDAPGFASVQMSIATLLFVALVAVAAFWPLPRKWRNADKRR